MHRNDVLRPSIVRHLHSLLRVAVRPDPWVVSANRHARQINRTLSAQIAESVNQGRVATKQHALATSAEHITVEAALGVMAPASAPMLHLESFNFHFAI